MTGPAPRVNVAELRARATLLPYLPPGNPVRRVNENLYVTLCVFHSEDRPSLRIARYRGVWRYHCFPCGADGDVIDFLMKARGLSFRDATRELGGEAVQLEAPSPLRSLDVLVCDACGGRATYGGNPWTNRMAVDMARLLGFNFNPKTLRPGYIEGDGALDLARKAIWAGWHLSDSGRALCPDCVEARLSDPHWHASFVKSVTKQRAA